MQILLFKKLSWKFWALLRCPQYVEDEFISVYQLPQLSGQNQHELYIELRGLSYYYPRSTAFNIGKPWNLSQVFFSRF